LIAAISPFEQVQAAMTSPQSKPLPLLVASIQAEFDQYLDLQRGDSPIFYANLIGLEVVPYSVPQGLVAHFSIVQPGHKNRNLRVRRNLSRPSTVPSELPNEGLQFGEGKKWLPLREWIERKCNTKIVDNSDAELLSRAYIFAEYEADIVISLQSLKS
jgi:hypothetical protein